MVLITFTTTHLSTKHASNHQTASHSLNHASISQTGQPPPPIPPTTPISAKHGARLLYRTTSIVVDPPPPEDNSYDGYWPTSGCGGHVDRNAVATNSNNNHNNPVTHQLTTEESRVQAGGNVNPNSLATGSAGSGGHGIGVNRSMLRTQRSLSGDALSSSTPVSWTMNY